MPDYPWEKLLDTERTRMESEVKISRKAGRPSLTTPTSSLHLRVSVDIISLLDEQMEKLKVIKNLSKGRLISYALYYLADAISQLSSEDLSQIKSFYELRMKLEEKNKENKSKKTTKKNPSG